MSNLINNTEGNEFLQYYYERSNNILVFNPSKIHNYGNDYLGTTVIGRI